MLWLLGMLLTAVLNSGALCRWRTVAKLKLLDGRQSFHVRRGWQREGRLVCSGHGWEIAAEKKEAWV